MPRSDFTADDIAGEPALPVSKSAVIGNRRSAGTRSSTPPCRPALVELSGRADQHHSPGEQQIEHHVRTVRRQPRWLAQSSPHQCCAGHESRRDAEHGADRSEGARLRASRVCHSGLARVPTTVRATDGAWGCVRPSPVLNVIQRNKVKTAETVLPVIGQHARGCSVSTTLLRVPLLREETRGQHGNVPTTPVRLTTEDVVAIQRNGTLRRDLARIHRR
jgi:hypothetical protein